MISRMGKRFTAEVPLVVGDLGVHTMPAKNALIIKQILTNGALDRYNRTNPPTLLKTGDRIVSCDSVKPDHLVRPDHLLKKLQEVAESGAPTVVLEIERL